MPKDKAVPVPAAAKPKAYSYLRFSTPEQQRGDSFRRQITAAQEYARQNGLDLDATGYEDRGVSAFRGRNAKQGRLAEFLSAVEAGDIPRGSFLLVESLDRISRNDAWDAATLLRNIVLAGVIVVTLIDKKVWDEQAIRDPMGMIMSVLLFARANEESVTKARRLQASWSNKRKQIAEGHIMTSICPAWLKLDETTGKFKPVPERAKVIRRIFSLAAKGEGQHAIARILNREAVPTLGRAQYWHRSYIAKILANPAAVGTLVPHVMEHTSAGKKRKPQAAVPGYYPAVVPRALYETVQGHRADAGAPQRGKHAGRPLNNILAGLARCPLCKGGVTVENKGGDYRYLVCAASKTEAGCKGGRARYAVVEEAFLENVDQVASDCPSDDDAAEELWAEVEDLEQGIDVAIDKMQELAETAANGKLGTARTINDRLVQLEAYVGEARERRDRLSEQAEAMTGAVLKKRVAKLREAANAPHIDRREINLALRALISAAEVDFKSGVLRLHWKHGAQPSEVRYDGAALFQ